MSSFGPSYLSAVICLIDQGFFDEAELLIKLKNKEYLNMQDSEDDYTALILVSRRGHLRLTQKLIEAGVDLNIKTSFGQTALMWAAYANKLEIVKALIEAGAALDIQDNDGDTALIYASRKGNLEIVRTLLKAGADPFILNNRGKNALEVSKKDVKEILQNSVQITNN